MDFSAKIVSFEETEDKDGGILADTRHTQYGEEKMGSTKSGFTAHSC